MTALAEIIMIIFANPYLVMFGSLLYLIVAYFGLMFVGELFTGEL